MSNMYFVPFRPAYDSAGISVPGSKHYFTVSDGGTGGDVPSAPFLDAALTIPASNPVVANGAGKIPTIYLDENITYRVRIYDRDAEVGVSTPLEEYAPYVPGAMGPKGDKGDPGGNVMATGLFTALPGQTIPAGADVARTAGYSTTGVGIADYAYDPAVDAAYVAANPLSSFLSANGRGFHWISREKTTPLEFGAVGDGDSANAAADTAAFASAIASGKRVRIPTGFTFRTNAQVPLVSGVEIEGDGGVIDFIASGGSPWLFALTGNIDKAAIRGVTFTCSTDIGFTALVRLNPASGETLSDLDFSDNIVAYAPATGPGSGDRWFIAGTGYGSRLNLKANRNRIEGPMQLVATPAGAGLLDGFEFNDNWLHNCRSNAISLLVIGTIGGGYANTVQNGEVSRNHISADAYTAIGIALGVDAPSPAADRNVILRNIRLLENDIRLTGVANSIGINCNVGQLASTIGGFDSVADTIIIDGGKVQAATAVQMAVNEGTGAVGAAKYTNFSMTGLRRVQGDITLYNMADGALLRNVDSSAASVRLGSGNGRIESECNHFTTFVPLDANAEFTWLARHDTYVGSASSIDRVVTLNANAGKVQKAEFDHCTIDSSTTAAFGIRSAIYTTGAGNPTVEVRNLTSSTDWGVSRYEVDTGSITDTTGGRWFSAAYDPPSLAAGAMDAVQTMTATGAAVGDDVRIVFNQPLQGLRLETWVSAADTISYRFSNPTAGAVDLGAGQVRATFIRPTL